MSFLLQYKTVSHLLFRSVGKKFRYSTLGINCVRNKRVIIIPPYFTPQHFKTDISSEFSEIRNIFNNIFIFKS